MSHVRLGRVQCLQAWSDKATCYAGRDLQFDGDSLGAIVFCPSNTVAFQAAHRPVGLPEWETTPEVVEKREAMAVAPILVDQVCLQRQL